MLIYILQITFRWEVFRHGFYSLNLLVPTGLPLERLHVHLERPLSTCKLKEVRNSPPPERTNTGTTTRSPRKTSPHLINTQIFKPKQI